MISVGIRELKNRLSEYLRMVRRGEVIMVTDRGEAVAELHQPVNAPEAAIYPELLRRARTGKVRLGGSNHAGLYPRVPATMAPGTAQRLLREERGER